MARSRRERKCTAVVLGDLDHFKNINDTYGHLVGDQVLKEIARRLKSSVRSYDFVGRYGGEEFLIALHNCNPAHGLARAEEIRKTIGERPVETTAGPIPITMSLGLLLSDDWGKTRVGDLLQEVDAALYAAKAAGRNCVRLATPKTHSEDARAATPEPARLRH